MRRAFRHSGVLMMVAVVALGLLGAAYTLWFEDLTINTTVNTGTFDADVSLHSWLGEDFETENTLDNGVGKPVVIVCSNPIPASTQAAHNVLASIGSGNPYGCTFGGFPAGKPPTTCTATIGTEGTVPENANDVVDDNALNLVLSGLYPFAGCTFRIDVHNSGSVPMHLNVLTDGIYKLCDAGSTFANPINCSDITPPVGPGSPPAISTITTCQAPVGPSVTPQAVATIDPNGQLDYAGGAAVQLHKGQEMVCDVTILLDQGPDLENKVILASSGFRAYQWNETVDTTTPTP